MLWFINNSRMKRPSGGVSDRSFLRLAVRGDSTAALEPSRLFSREKSLLAEPISPGRVRSVPAPSCCLPRSQMTFCLTLRIALSSARHLNCHYSAANHIKKYYATNEELPPGSPSRPQLLEVPPPSKLSLVTLLADRYKDAILRIGDNGEAAIKEIRIREVLIEDMGPFDNA